jgi:hypothetical protein
MIADTSRRRPRLCRRGPAPAGVALVIVLAFLLLISILAVAFFASVTAELKGARNYAGGVSTRQLADSAVQIVMGQIADATTRGIDPTTGLGREGWASQPGLLRVFDATGNPDSDYLLYSSNNMVRSGTALAGYDPTSDYNAQWDTLPALWTDLNAPVLSWDYVASANSTPANPNYTWQEVPRFPIIDPRAFSDSTLSSPIQPPTQQYGTAWAQNAVEGFWYDPNAKVDGLVPPGTHVSNPPNAQRLPMPVQWIYVLLDGTLTVPNGGQPGSGANPSTATFTYGDHRQPTKANPIIGRIAFWTDDETCKLNLNTAAGYINTAKELPTGYTDATMFAGSYWDTPHYYTRFDYGNPYPSSAAYPLAGTPQPGGGGLALCQLVQNEFQRYPGHPATTSLAPVLGNLMTSEQLYGLTPRYSNVDMTGQPGSTKGGTQRVIVDNSGAGSAATLGNDGLPNTRDNRELQPKQDRLYASVDELLFGAHAGGMNVGIPNTGTAGYRRMVNDFYTNPPLNASVNGNPRFTPAVLTPQLIDSLRFFLTTESRAPELNLWGQPRVTAWPVRAEDTQEVSGLNVFDNLILFCSTIGAEAAGSSATRPNTSDAASNGPDASCNGQYRYIFTRREIGSNVDSATPPNFTGTQDCELARNKYLLGTYLANFLNGSAGNIPGFGTNWSSKYTPSDQQSILTEIFDYIRCANAHDTTTSLSSGTPVPFAPQGVIMPSVPATYFKGVKGTGRMSTIYEASIVFYYAGPVMAAEGSITVDGVSVNNSGWSRWDPVNPNARYVQENSYPKASTTKVPQKYMRAFLLFSTFNPMQGYAPMADPVAASGSTPGSCKMSIQATWESDPSVTFSSGDSSSVPNMKQQMSWSNLTAANSVTTVNRAPGAYWGGRNFGGYEGFAHTLMGGAGGKEKIAWAPGSGGNSYLSASDYGTTQYPTTGTSWGTVTNAFTSVPATNQEYYPFQTSATAPVKVPVGATSFQFSGGYLDVVLAYGGVQLQTIKMYFPQANFLPVPCGDPQVLYPLGAKNPVAASADVTTWDATADATNFGGPISSTNQGAQGMGLWYWRGHGAFFQNNIYNLWFGPSKLTNYTYGTSLQASWSLATRLAWCMANSGGSADPAYEAPPNQSIPASWNGDRWHCLVQPGDTVRSLLYWDGNDYLGNPLSQINPIKSGDLRLGQLTAAVQPASFAPHPDYSKAYARACCLRGGDGNFYLPPGTPSTSPAYGSNPSLDGTLGNQIYLGTTGLARVASNGAFGNLPWGGGQGVGVRGVNGVLRSFDGKAGDFDNGVGDFPDGPFCNKQDEGNVIYRYWDNNAQTYVYPIPYFTSTFSYQQPGNTFTSPSRQMPSPVMFGSLPSRVPEGRQWETLCFCPNPAGANHPGNTDPKDHLLLDLFQMPVVEPYPISEPFSTAGKVNLNYHIAPFDYIRRSSAIRGALHPIRVVAVSSQYTLASGTGPHYLTYKTGTSTGPLSDNFRILLDRDQMIQELDAVYYNNGANNGFFKSASQICEQYLIPWEAKDTPLMSNSVTANQNTMQAWWASPWDLKGTFGNGDLTGDNEREKPYADLYPRLTTRSNTFTMHVKVQTLRQLPRSADPAYATWNEGKDAILGEYRGSSTIERYLDPSDPRIGASGGIVNGYPTINPDTQSLEPLYRFRTIITKKFSP